MTYPHLSLNSAPPATLSPADIERLARRRAGAKLGWFIHAAVYVCVNALLMTISSRPSRTRRFRDNSQ